MTQEEKQWETPEKPNSVEIGINAKGQYSGKVKVYAESIDEAMSKAKERSKELEELIKAKNGDL